DVQGAADFFDLVLPRLQLLGVDAGHADGRKLPVAVQDGDAAFATGAETLDPAVPYFLGRVRAERGLRRQDARGARALTEQVRLGLFQSHRQADGFASQADDVE